MLRQTILNDGVVRHVGANDSNGWCGGTFLGKGI